ncbi:adenylosuccinate lyase family protein [Rhodobacteraceae bacterium CCMM004]|nr:adenylosuccinate lyase family protein [Rhodobacteraceae bacterium CCMM004]
MPATVFDSAAGRDLWHDADTARLFGDGAEIRAMLLVWGALAEAQGALGVIPETAAAAIQRAAHEIAVDPASLSAETGANGVLVPALAAAVRAAMQAPEHSQYLHWGATSQDIVDTALALRLRRCLTIWQERLDATLDALARLARQHAETPMAGRTWGLAAAPISFGAVVAGWGWPVLRQVDRLDRLRPEVLCVSLSGAAGTLSILHPHGPAIRRRIAEAMDLGDPGTGWHAARDGIAGLAAWTTTTLTVLAKMGADLELMAQTDPPEIALPGAGASSTMPQKRNPVQPAQLRALAALARGLNAPLQGAAEARQQRDGAAWMTEWLALPPLAHAMGRATLLARDLAAGIAPDADAMAAAVDGGAGLIHAEALSFALAQEMPRPEAQALVKRLCRQAAETGTPLADLMAAERPGRDWAAVARAPGRLGTAPDDARAFAAAVDARRTAG